ncbi:hypothetical protein [Geomonas azotofigens]|uniref:hypothetical protein n=1 Tax=Geomonas azotofigens TaxID=2843196 RepID=UPI001C110C07|nr:hypothetical protein [Geomonas azotofigens]MBU5611684.1 hypothetical protein [Geomonas azotofigens]
MAGSRQLHLRRDPFQRPTLTPGPLGHNDASSPNTPKGLIGDTPGPLGVNDGAALLANHRFQKRLPRATTAVRWIALADVQALALDVTTYFEGGEAKYGTLAGDDDDQATSFGLLQWNFGQNTLGPLLKKMLKADPLLFETCFPKGTNYEKLKASLMAGDASEQRKWARELLRTNRSGWQTSFKNIARVAQFNEIQKQEAIANYHHLVMKAITCLRTIRPSDFQRIEINTYVALFDLCVQQHGIEQSKARIVNEIGVRKPASQQEIMRIVITERGLLAKQEYRADCISRRMGILTGEEFTATQQGHRVRRKNPKLALLATYRGAYVRL